MKVRKPVICEAPWCKSWIQTGTIAVLFHGRHWHLACATRYIRQRRDTQRVPA